MNDDTIDDLKQFIAGAVTQQTSDLRQEIDRLDQKIDKKIDSLDAKLDKKFSVLDKKIDDLSLMVGEALDVANESNELRFKDHEKRITKLERQTA